MLMRMLLIFTLSVSLVPASKVSKPISNHF